MTRAEAETQLRSADPDLEADVREAGESFKHELRLAYLGVGKMPHDREFFGQVIQLSKVNGRRRGHHAAYRVPIPKQFS